MTGHEVLDEAGLRALLRRQFIRPDSSTAEIRYARRTSDAFMAWANIHLPWSALPGDLPPEDRHGARASEILAYRPRVVAMTVSEIRHWPHTHVPGEYAVQFVAPHVSGITQVGLFSAGFPKTQGPPVQDDVPIAVGDVFFVATFGMPCQPSAEATSSRVKNRFEGHVNSNCLVLSRTKMPAGLVLATGPALEIPPFRLQGRLDS